MIPFQISFGRALPPQITVAKPPVLPVAMSPVNRVSQPNGVAPLQPQRIIAPYLRPLLNPDPVRLSATVPAKCDPVFAVPAPRLRQHQVAVPQNTPVAVPQDTPPTKAKRGRSASIKKTAPLGESSQSCQVTHPSPKRRRTRKASMPADTTPVTVHQQPYQTGLEALLAAIAATEAGQHTQ